MTPNPTQLYDSLMAVAFTIGLAYLPFHFMQAL